MTSEAALTKLAYLLAFPDATPESVAREMSVSLRGELTPHSQMVFSHPSGGLPERVKTLTTLGYAIMKGDLDRVTEITRGGKEWLLNDADYSGNTPLVSSNTLFCSFRSISQSNLTFPSEITASRCYEPEHLNSTSPTFSRRLSASPEPQWPNTALPRCKCRFTGTCLSSTPIRCPPPSGRNSSSRTPCSAWQKVRCQ